MRVALVQISMGLWRAPAGDRSGQSKSYGHVPYSVGMLQAYAQVHARDQHEYAMPVHRRMPVAEAVERLRGFDLVALSVYVWNVELSLAIARALRAVEPDTIIVLGGPQVPERVEPFLAANPFVDVVAHGEGEITFTELLDAAPDRAWDTVRSVSYVDGHGQVVSTARRERVGDLDLLPSPYLTGVFDQVMAAEAEDGWVMMWETNRGCPFSCTFCDWGSATGSKVYRFGMDRLEAEIAWMGQRQVGFVICCDANFGMLPRDVDIARAVVAEQARSGYPVSLSVQNTKNARERAYEVQTIIAGSLNTVGVTISLQSANRDTLTNIKRRNVSSSAFEDLQRRFAADGLYTYTDLILGLPGETYDMFADGISYVVANGQHNHVQFFNCSVLPNAEMGDPAYQQQYGLRMVPQRILSVHNAVEPADEVAEHLDIVVETAAMPPPDWCRAQVFAWLTDLLYFDRVVQVPLAVLGRRYGVPLRAFVEAVTDADPTTSPVIGGVVSLLEDHARAVQGGGDEYLTRADAGGVWWPPDQFALITLTLDGQLPAFYREAEALVAHLLEERGLDVPPLLLGELFDHNAAVLRRPGPARDGLLMTSYPIDELYQAVLHGGDGPELAERWTTSSIDRTTKPLVTVSAWLAHLVWCHGKDKRAYLSALRPAGISALRPAAPPSNLTKPRAKAGSTHGNR